MTQLALQTRDGWDIRNELRSEAALVSLKAFNDVWTTKYPDLQVRSLTQTYNCGGMVFANRRVWVDPEDFHQILIRDGFRQLANSHDVERGDVVIYLDDSKAPCHVGLVLAKNVYSPEYPRDPVLVLSKWGAAGEYIHDLLMVPDVYGKQVEFWTDRRHT